MYHIRTTRTASGATAIQVVRYDNRKLIVVVHIGSAHTEEEIQELKKSARKWIEKISKQQSLLPDTKNQSSNLVSLEKCRYLGFRYSFLYEIMTQVFIRFKFSALKNDLLNDMVLVRILEPSSKLHSLELLEEFFGIKHLRKHFYEEVPRIAVLKDEVEKKVLALAKKEFLFDLSLVFYDVTTLYFESFESDGLRKPGFSKDNKTNQPQILIGLVVSADGFPIAYEIFPGNKFEGHTLIPTILNFKKKHSICTLTIIADAAMISFENIKALKDNGLKYIVGARIGNLPLALIETISNELGLEDGSTIRIETGHGIMICNFSAKRYRKDKHEMEKQLEKAGNSLKNPSRVLKRSKFLKVKDGTSYELNNGLIEKTKLLLGIKGYYTNLENEIDDNTIISHYHNLWHIEQAFRIAKSDLKIRPIYHLKKQTIETHIMICFMALAIAKYMEIKTGKSIKSIIRLFKSVTDARILNTLTNEEIILRSEISKELKDILSKLNLSY